VYIFTREKLKGKRNGVIRAKVECIYKAKEIENERERESRKHVCQCALKGNKVTKKDRIMHSYYLNKILLEAII
jgi:hypothetical protein